MDVGPQSFQSAVLSDQNTIDPVTGQSLADRTAVVTGSGRGLGRAYALRLAALDAAVVVTDIDGDSASRVAGEIRSMDGSALDLSFDVGDEGPVQESIEAVRAWATSPIAVLVNNAALFASISLKPLTEISSIEWDAVMGVNVRGPFLMAKHIAPVMAEHRYGKIVNVSSSTIWTGRPGYLHYVTSKSALIGMTRALARELGGNGIRVNAITPGPTRTEVERATMDDDRWSTVAGLSALGKYATPHDICDAVMFLVSPESDHITGQTLNVDAGTSMP